MVTKTAEPDYTETEIGIIPSDWEIDEIQNQSHITTGSRNTQDRIEDGRFPFFVRSQKIERINSFSYDGEAVLTAGDGVGTGKVFHYITGKFDFHQRVYKISDFSEKLDGYFFYLYFSHNFLSRIMSMTAKSSVDSVRMGMIAEMMIPLPEKKEQIAIAKAIGDISELIENLEKLIDKKKHIKEGVMQKLLTGKQRLHGFGDKSKIKKGCKRTELGVIPEDWDVLTLGDVCTSINDGTHFTPNYVRDGIPFYSVENVTGNNFIDVKFISEREHNNLIRRCKPEKDDILFTRIGALAETKLIDWDVNASIYVSLALLKVNKEKVKINYLYAYTKSNQFKYSVEKRSLTNAAPQKINMNEIGKVPILVPGDKEEQTAIGQILSDMDVERHELEKMRDKYFMIMRGIMQQLFSGRIRLS